MSSDNVDFDEERVLRMSENAKFHRVCEYIYQKQRKFTKVFDCLLNDGDRARAVRFDWIELLIACCLGVLFSLLS
jgi:hypothetical protein